MNYQKFTDSLQYGSYLKRVDFCKKYNLPQSNKHLIDILQNRYTSSDNQKIYIDWFFKQNIENGFLPEQLYRDNLEDRYYDRIPKGKNKNMARKMLNYYNTKVVIDIESRKVLRQIIKDAINNINTFILTNHTTFANIPIIIIELIKIGIEMGLNDQHIMNIMTTILGPALMTQIQKFVIQEISRIRKTHPKTDNGIIPLLETVQFMQSGKCTNELITDCKENPGNIILISPPGQRDTTERLSKSDSQIFFGNDETPSVSSTLNTLILKSITEKRDGEERKRNNKVALIAVNDSELKNPYYVNTKNNERKKDAIIYITVQVTTNSEMQELIKSKSVMNTLAEGVINGSGEQIARAVNSEELNNIKKRLTK